ncbi:hypothetical protein MLD38_009036 [Melastoma candidum]|uniref:Uncharacterized protein n=1 Tax=Melastoma candidum TaxID=119954 RepID=A0ACB9S0L5_9MYRT|nr:hypothetical protein MLD38_009036 [Melastoma candidum]
MLRTYEDIKKESWKSTRWSLLFVLNLVAASFDPLFFYIPIIDDKSKCLKLDRNLGITAISLRFCADIFQLILWLLCNEEQLPKLSGSSIHQRADLMDGIDRPASSLPSADATSRTDEPTSSMRSADATSRQRKHMASLLQFVSVLPLPQVQRVLLWLVLSQL